MKRLFLMAALFAALSASALDTVTVIPQPIDSGTPVELRIPNICHDPSYELHRRGFEIVVELTGCSIADPPFTQTLLVPMGTLPAGEYHVTVTQPDETAPLAARGSFVVVDHRPFTIHPAAVPANTALPYELLIPYDVTVSRLCPTLDCPIRIGGAEVSSKRFVGGDFIAVTAPAHAPGAVDVTVGNQTSFGALYYFDTTVPPDTAYFERVLVPVLFNTRGVGSDWRSEAVFSNAAAWTIETFAGERFAPRSKQRVSGGPYAHGWAFVTPRAEADNLALALRVRDVLRVSEGFGTEIPIVREKDMFRDSVMLLNVPIDSRYRVKVRLYAFDVPAGGAAMLSAKAQAFAVPFEHTCTDVRTCAATPAYAEFTLPRGEPDMRSDFFFELPPGSLGWAFATVTNNETQQVTIVTPDGKGGAFICPICSRE